MAQEGGVSGARLSVIIATDNASGWRALQEYLEVTPATIVAAQETHIVAGDDAMRASA